MAKLPELQKRKHRGRPSARTTAGDKLRRKYAKLEAYDVLHGVEQGLVGVDEAGRGALAGPVVAAAVVLPRGSELLGVDDSKKLTEEQREAVFPVIVEKALAVGISYSHPITIELNNILNASLMAMAAAVGNLRMDIGLILLDGRDKIDIPQHVIPVIGGDGKSLSIAAASVVAKVARDRLMRKLHKVYPLYNFNSNKGYGTKEHIVAIQRHGVSSVHRKSYCASAVDNTPSLF